MNTLEIKLLKRRPLLNLLGIGSRYSMPSQWNELTKNQLLTVSDVMFSNIDIYVAQLKIAQSLSRIPLIAFEFMSDLDKLALCNSASWVMDFKTIQLTSQLLPLYKGYYGPSDELANITVREFIYADGFFGKYMNTRTEDQLDTMIAILYREKKKGKNENDDVRVKFNNHLTDSRIKKIKKWPAKIKHAICLYYQGCRNKIVADNEELFAGGSGEENPFGLYTIVSDLAPKFGSIENAMDTRLKVFMIEWKKQLHDQSKKRR